MESIIIDLEKTVIGRTRGDGMEENEAEGPKLEEVSVELKERETSTMGPVVALNRTDSGAVTTTRRSSHTSANSVNCSSSSIPGLHSLYRRPEVIVTRSLAPAIPKGELVLLKPRRIDSAKATRVDHKKMKIPKFIPFEPYPGAVNPIVPRPSLTPNPTLIANKNNLDIGVLVRQMSTMRTQELTDSVEKEPNRSPETSSGCEDGVKELQMELQKMRNERDYFQGQFKFQTQVNSELKNLLVASVGEDLQTRVNVLTEDKLQLARALLDTANNLTTHTEQIEFLAGQCEVWRSKFLGSSVMVEELARWKADLTQKNEMLDESTKRLLHATHQIRELQLEILKHLKFLAKLRYLNLPATDVISLSAENLNILQQMVLHSGVGMPEANLNLSSANTNLLCDAEQYAVRALEFISQPLMATDEAIRALFDQAKRPVGTIAMTSNADAIQEHL